MREGHRQTGNGLKPSRFVLTAGFSVMLALGSCAIDGDRGPIAFSGSDAQSAALHSPAPATRSPTRLNNMSGSQIVAMLGEPGFKRQENPAQIWRYRSEECVLELMLYRLDSDYQVRHVEARDDKFRAVAQNQCIDSIATRKQRPLLRS